MRSPSGFAKTGVALLLFVSCVAAWRFWVVNSRPGLRFELRESSDSREGELVLRVVNQTANGISIVGSQTSCSCGYVYGLPVVVPANGSSDLKLITAPSLQESDTSKDGLAVEFFLDNGGISSLKVALPVVHYLKQRQLVSLQ